MKSQQLLRAMEQINDAYIMEAAPGRRKKFPRTVLLRWGTLAAVFALVIGLGGYQLVKNLGGSAGGGGDVGYSYMGYYGPVFPMTALSDAEGITAERQINYDFGESIHRSLVTDQYWITNSADHAQTIRFAYPVAGDLSSEADTLPTIVVKGETINAQLNPGPYTGGFEGTWGDRSGESTSTNYDFISSWEGYKRLLSTDAYMQSAFDPYPQLNQSIIIYEITDYVIHGEGSNPTLNVEFYIDRAKTTVMTYGMNGGTYNSRDGYEARHFGVPAPGEYGYGDAYYIVLVGEDLKSYSLQGYEDGGCDKGEEIEITAKVTRKNSTLQEFLWSLVDEDRVKSEEPQYIGDLISNEMYFGLMAELLTSYGVISESGVEKFQMGDIEHLFAATNTNSRIFYLTFEVTLSAGERVALTCTMKKRAHVDYVGKDANRNGYDLVTQLGSNLVFTRQTASVTNAEKIEMIRQDFGFDPEKGITEVLLDPKKEYYRMDIRVKSEEDS